MTRKELETLGFTVKENGRIDFDKPPVGKQFVPVPTDEDDIKESQVDRDFVTFHKFSATTMKVKMVLVDESEADKAKAYVAAIKAKCKKEERKKRCRIVSPKTGRKIMCPETFSCYRDDCPKKRGIGIFEEPEVILFSDLTEAEMMRGTGDDPIFDVVATKIDRDIFKKKIRKEHPGLARIIQMIEEGYQRDDIMKEFHKEKKQTSWYYSQMDQINRLWEEFYKD